MKKTLLIPFFVLSTVLLALTGCVNTQPATSAMEHSEFPEPQYMKARVLEIKDLIPEDPDQVAYFDMQIITVKVTGGKFDGQVITVEHIIDESSPYNIHIQPKDEVLLAAEIEGEQLVEAYIESHARDRQLKTLSVVFIATLVLLGRGKGLKSAITLGFTVVAIVKVLLPLILRGYNPILLAVSVSAVVTAFTLVLVSGANRKTLSAVVGTTGGVLVAGAIAVKAGTAAKLTGLSSQESVMLMFIPQQTGFDFRGLLFAGIIIGALGAVMDVSMSISSAMDEIKQVSPGLPRRALIQSGMNVGSDLMGTMSNTLILAYTSGSLPMLLLFFAYDTPLIKIVNLEFIATEIVRALAGSLGLIMAIPITAVAGGYILTGKEDKKTAPRDRSRSRSRYEKDRIGPSLEPQQTTRW